MHCELVIMQQENWASFFDLGRAKQLKHIVQKYLMKKPFKILQRDQIYSIDHPKVTASGNPARSLQSDPEASIQQAARTPPMPLIAATPVGGDLKLQVTGGESLVAWYSKPPVAPFTVFLQTMTLFSGTFYFSFFLCQWRFSPDLGIDPLFVFFQ